MRPLASGRRIAWIERQGGCGGGDMRCCGQKIATRSGPVRLVARCAVMLRTNDSVVDRIVESIHVCFPRTHLALPRKRHSKISTNVSATHCPSDSDLPHPSEEHGISRLRKRITNFLRITTFGLVFRYLASGSGQLYSCYSTSSLVMPKRCASPSPGRLDRKSTRLNSRH